MKIRDLLELLEDVIEQAGPDAEVRLMTQQHYPFENEVRGVCTGGDINEGEDPEDGDVVDEQVVYIVEGEQLGYGSKRAWDVT